MSHIHTGPGQHDLTASGLLVRVDGPEPRVLLHRHIKLNKIMQFGGHVELNENPWQTLIRELQEEAGYDIDQLRVLQPKQRIKKLTPPSIILPQPVCVLNLIYTGVESHFHDDLMYGFVISDEPRHKISSYESSERLLLSREELLAIPQDQIFDDVREISLYILDVCLVEWEAIKAESL